MLKLFQLFRSQFWAMFYIYIIKILEYILPPQYNVASQRVLFEKLEEYCPSFFYWMQKAPHHQGLGPPKCSLHDIGTSHIINNYIHSILLNNTAQWVVHDIMRCIFPQKVLFWIYEHVSIISQYTISMYTS